MSALLGLALWLQARLESKYLPYALALLSVLITLPALWGGFQLDDHFQRYRLLGLSQAPAITLFEFYDGNPEENAELKDAGVLPWWASEDLCHKNLRYLSVLTMMLDFALWPESPALMHAHSLVWLAALVIAVSALYRETLGIAWPAGLAALLYALDDFHAAPTAYLANRNALIATVFGVLCVLAYVRRRKAGWRPGAWLSPLCFALGLAAAEMAVATAAFLGAWALFADEGRWRERLMALVPNIAVAMVYVAVYRAFEFGAAGSGFYVNPTHDPLVFLSTVVERAPYLLMGVLTFIPADLSLVSDPTANAAAVLWWIGTCATAALVFLLWPVFRFDRVARFFAVAALLSLLPITATGAQNRLLFFVALGVMPLVAKAIQLSLFPLSSRVRRSVLRCAAVLLLLMHVGLAPWIGGLLLANQAQAEVHLRRALATLPTDLALAEQTLVLVNPPDYTYTVGAIVPARRTAGAPAPVRVRALSVGSSPIEVTRVDAHSLDVTIAYGLFSTPISRYFRAAERPLPAASIHAIDGLTVEVRSVTAAGDPKTLRYRFAVPLEDPSLRWLRWRDRAYAAWSPPAVGSPPVRWPGGKGIFDPD